MGAFTVGKRRKTRTHASGPTRPAHWLEAVAEKSANVNGPFPEKSLFFVSGTNQSCPYNDFNYRLSLSHSGATRSLANIFIPQIGLCCPRGGWEEPEGDRECAKSCQ